VTSDATQQHAPLALHPSPRVPRPPFLLPPLSSLLLAAVTVAAAGCSRGPSIVPVQGKVHYNGQPLAFGSVMLQPDAGQPARAKIQPDGTFKMTTNRFGDGATVGRNRVRVTCYEGQGPSAAEGEGEPALGKSLIPRRYADIDTSGIVVQIEPPGNDNLVIELTDDAG